MANVIKHKRGSGSDPAANNLVLGELAIRTDTGKLFTKMDSGAIAEIAGGGSDIAINTLSSSSGTGGGSATFNGSAYRFTLSAPPNVSAAQLLVSINGVIQKPVAGTGQPSEGFSVDGTDIILGDAPATGADFFILTFKSLGVSEPADNSVTSAKIADGAIVNADVNASAAIAGSKISPDFGSQNIVTTGDLTIDTNTLHVDASTNRVGIGTTSPDNILHLESSSNTYLQIEKTGTSSKVYLGNVGGEAILESTGGAIKLKPNGRSNDFVLNTSGNLGIGTASPSRKLHVASSFIRVDDGYGLDSSGSTEKVVLDNGFISLTTNNSERMRIDSSGNVGIGTTSPAANLHLKDGSGNTEIKLQGGPSTANDVIAFLNSAGSTRGNITYDTDNDFVLFNVNTSERMRIDSSGRLLLGTTTEGNTSGDDLTIATSDTTGITLRGGTSGGGRIFFSDGTSGADEYRGVVGYDHNTNHLYFSTDASERMRIDSSGDVLINSNSSIDVASTATSKLQIKHTSGNISAAFYSTVNGIGPAGVLALGHGRGSESGVLQDDDVLGQIRFAGGDGTDLRTIGALISAEVNGTPSVNVMPTDLIFSTNAGSGSTTERMRINSAGNVGIGGTAPNYQLHVVSTIGVGSHGFAQQISISNQKIQSLLLGTGYTTLILNGLGGDIVMGSGSTQRFAFGTNAGVKYAGFGPQHGAAQDVGLNFFTTTNAGTSFVNHFRIEHNGELYGTDQGIGSISDSRVKKNIVDYSYDIEKFKKYKSKTFDWVNPEMHGDKTNVKGFLAQDIEEVDSQWVTTINIDKDDPDYDLVDKGKNGENEDVGFIKTSKFGSKDAMYISVINQLIARVEALEAG